MASQLELRQLRYLIAVAETGRITQAARRLNIAQATVSEALGSLETQLGVLLLERQRRGVALTETGRLFAQRARTIVATADAAVAEARAQERRRSLQLVVAYTAGPMTRWGLLFQQLAAQHPSARLHWQIVGWPRIDRCPLEGADVGLLSEPPARPDLSTLVLQQEPLMAVMAATHRLAGRRELRVADIIHETWPGTEPTVDPAWHRFWRLDEQRAGPPRESDDRVGDHRQSFDAVASGRAISTAPANLAGCLPHPGIVSIPLIDAAPVRLALVWRTEHDNPLVESLVAIATAHTDAHSE